MTDEISPEDHSSGPVEDPHITFQNMSGRDDLRSEIFYSYCQVYQPSFICDIDAFNGDESFRFSKLSPESTIVAFEASPRNYRQFYIDSDRFAGIPNFRINHMAISDYTGEITFNVLDAGEASDWRQCDRP